ncbi:MAG: hypothetical protein HQM08_20630 [Candidatus Riflebacteria bacterium]|nr:hypothetical protein [Candidatus Riflebacteria bacterium]
MDEKWAVSGKILFLFSIIAIILGVIAGEPEFIWAIGTMICTKCIGIG